MALDEELDPFEMKVLLCNKAATVANRIFVEGEHGLGREELVQITGRMHELAQALPPERKN